MAIKGKSHFVYSRPDTQYGLEVMYSEASAAVVEVYTSLKAVKDAALVIFSSGSLIVALMGAFRIFDRTVLPQNAAWHTWLVIASLVLYIPLIILSMCTILPIRIVTPIAPNWDEYHKAFWKESRSRILRQRIINCLVAVEKNKKIVEKHKPLVTASAILLATIVILLSIARLLP